MRYCGLGSVCFQEQFSLYEWDNNPRDRYVYGQSVRGADAEFKKWVLKGGYKTEKFTDVDGRELTFIHKSRLHPKTIQVNVTVPGRRKRRRNPFPLTRSRWPITPRNMPGNRKK